MVRRYCSPAVGAAAPAAAPAEAAVAPAQGAVPQTAAEGPPVDAVAAAPAGPSSSSCGSGGSCGSCGSGGTVQPADMPAGASAGAPGPATPNGAAPLGGAAARRYIQRLLRAPPSMHAALLSPCGVLLYTASLGPRDCSVRVWGLLPGGGGDGGPQPELHRTLHGHTAPVLSLALSPCGGLLLTGSYDQTVRVWSTADWHCLRVLKGHGGGCARDGGGPRRLHPVQRGSGQHHQGEGGGTHVAVALLWGWQGCVGVCCACWHRGS